MISRLLHIELPPIEESVKQDNRSAIIWKIVTAIDAIDTKLYQKGLEELAYCLRLPLEECRSLAQSAETDTRVLDVLAKDTDSSVRKAAAANYETPFHTVVSLEENDPDESVRNAASESLIRARGIPHPKQGFIPPKPPGTE